MGYGRARGGFSSGAWISGPRPGNRPDAPGEGARIASEARPDGLAEHSPARGEHGCFQSRRPARRLTIDATANMVWGRRLLWTRRRPPISNATPISSSPIEALPPRNLATYPAHWPHSGTACGTPAPERGPHQLCQRLARPPADHGSHAEPSELGHSHTVKPGWAYREPVRAEHRTQPGKGRNPG